MSNIFFQPFVGKEYGGGPFGKRIMVLGESHYCGEECADCGDCSLHKECMNFTTNVVQTYLKRNGGLWMNTYLKFERSLVGHETDSDETERIWNSVIFYNYLQVAMDESRQAGTAEQYRRAADALFETLERYLPEYVIVWGKRLWNNLPSERWADGEDIVVDGCPNATGTYTLRSGKRVKMMVVYHPSAGYSWDYWHRVIQRFLQ